MSSGTRITIYILLSVGVFTSGLSWLMLGDKSLPFKVGPTLLLVAALVLLTSMYSRKVDVLSRGGIVKFNETPWSYRLYYSTLYVPTFILFMVIWF
jgi:hypothetical protein